MDSAMHLMRCLSFCLAKWGVSLLCSIPGTQNGAANALSPFISEASARGERNTHKAVRQPATLPGAGDSRLDKGRLDILVRSYFV